MKQQASGEQGFSLIELMVAVALTLVVSGAIFALLTAGQNAFRREPELTDRQQNIRLATALLEQDVVNAGAKMGAYARAFTNGLDGAGPLGLNGAQSDFFEMIGDSLDCPDVYIGGSADPNLTTTYRLPDCYPQAPATGLFALFYPSAPTMWGLGAVSAGGPTWSGITFGAQPANPSGPPPAPRWIASSAEITGAARIGLLQVVRYEIAPGPDGAPSLYRSMRGGIGDTGAYVAAPGAAGGWQLVARGIEDLQVQYQTGVDATVAANWNPGPGTPVAGDPLTVVRRVQLTLSARSMARGLQGETADAIDPYGHVRGQLVTEVSPREALLGLQFAGGGANYWR